MMKYNLLMLLALTFFSCSKQQQTDHKPLKTEKESSKKSQTHTANALLFHQTAAEYKALCYQTYNLSKLILNQKIKAHSDTSNKPIAIVMDLDETVVDNSFYNAQLLLDSADYTQKTWKNWSDLAKAEAIPGAIDFIKYAQGLGVNVVFISNRRVAELKPTIKNLEKLGITNIDSNHYLLREKEGSKKNRRAQVSEKYEIAMLFGDNLADFTELFDKRSTSDRNNLVDSLHQEFGDKFIVLPNVIYGDWEGSLYNYKYNWTSAQKDSIRLQFIKGYK